MEIFPLLVARLGIGAMSLDSHKERFHTVAFVADWAVAIIVNVTNAEARNQDRKYLHQIFGNNGYTLNFIKRDLR